MQLDQDTLARLIAAALGGSSGGASASNEATSTSPFEIGAPYLLRTVTHIVTGRVVRVGPQEIVVAEAAWIADTGRYSNAIRSGNFLEVEPYPDGEVVVGRGALIDACIVPALPRAQK